MAYTEGLNQWTNGAPYPRTGLPSGDFSKWFDGAPVIRPFALSGVSNIFKRTGTLYSACSDVDGTDRAAVARVNNI